MSSTVDEKLGPLTGAVEARMAALSERRVAPRLIERDPTLWSDDPEVGAAIGNRLGWIDCPSLMRERVAELDALRGELTEGGFTHAVLLGMGGSSLGADVLRATFERTGLELRVLDSTAPGAVRAVAEGIAPERTAFLVCSKSGSTVEVLSFLDHFWATGEDGGRFVAITDPDSPLEELASARGFRRVFLNPADIGGRFSVLSLFGLVPGALLGMDVGVLLERAGEMRSACGGDVTPERHPGLRLGAILGEAARAGRDKLTLALDPEIGALGAWIEQLVAESTGKGGQGVLPVDGEPALAPDAYPDDRLFVVVSLGERPSARAGVLAGAGHPVVEIRLRDRHDLGGEFLRWEMATAVCGHVLGLNPFDEPNVREAKRLTGERLDAFAATGTLDDVPGACTVEQLEAHLRQAGPGEYVAYLAFLPPTDETAEALAELAAATRSLGVPTVTVGVGPRYLHSTGQLHKGGPDSGVFVVVTGEPGPGDPTGAIPGRGYGFDTLVRAQALGDLDALRARDRRVLRIHLDEPPAPALRSLARDLGPGSKP